MYTTTSHLFKTVTYIMKQKIKGKSFSWFVCLLFSFCLSIFNFTHARVFCLLYVFHRAKAAENLIGVFFPSHFLLLFNQYRNMMVLKPMRSVLREDCLLLYALSREVKNPGKSAVFPRAQQSEIESSRRPITNFINIYIEIKIWLRWYRRKSWEDDFLMIEKSNCRTQCRLLHCPATGKSNRRCRSITILPNILSKSRHNCIAIMDE